MFGRKFLRSTIAVITTEFDYPPAPIQIPILKRIARTARKGNLNEYDAAILFMAVQMNSLIPNNMENRRFISRHLRNILQIEYRAKSDNREIEEMLYPIRQRYELGLHGKQHGQPPKEFVDGFLDIMLGEDDEEEKVEKFKGLVFGSASGPPETERFPATFDEWLRRFKWQASKKSPYLPLSEDGGSLIDFMDHAPLKRAFEDRVSPEKLGNQFAESFDPKTFGM